MLYILNAVLPEKRTFRSAIRAVYGIGLSRSIKIASVLGLHERARIEDVSVDNVKKIGELIEKSFVVDFELRRRISVNIKVLRTNTVYRGYRHKFALPTRGQRTHTNASTARKLLVLPKDIVERDREKNRGPKRKKNSHLRAKDKKKNKKK